MPTTQLPLLLLLDAADGADEADEEDEEGDVAEAVAHRCHLGLQLQPLRPLAQPHLISKLRSIRRLARLHHQKQCHRRRR